MKPLGLILVCWVNLGASTLWWGPYLQDVSRTRATVMWAARGEGSGGVAIRTADGAARLTGSRVTVLLPGVTGLDEPLYLHKAAVSGLTPDSPHHYRLVFDGQPTGTEFTFRTAGDGPLRFLVLGDSGDLGTPQRRLAALLEEEQANLLLHVGDIAYWEGTFQQYATTFFGVYPALLARTPLFTVPGNHDYLSDAFVYRQLFSLPSIGVPAQGIQRYYSFDWGNVHFVTVDSNTPLLEAEHGDRTMLDWLERDLGATQQTWRVVAFHHPPFPSTPYKLDDPACERTLRHLTPILERHAVHLVLNGHEHIYQRTKARWRGRFRSGDQGTIYVTAGGGGSQIYDPGSQEFIASAKGASHYLRIEASSSELRIEAVGFGPELLDRWPLPAAPALEHPAALDAAAFTPGIAPGGLFTIFGWNLAPGSGGHALTRVLLGGAEVPMIFASRTQINAQLPFDAPAEADLEVRTPTGTAHTTILTRPAAPAIFTVGEGEPSFALALHSGGQPVTIQSPARPGEPVDLFTTGLGRVKGNIRPGEPPPESPPLEVEAPVFVRLGTLDVNVVRARLAPGLPGVYRVTIVIPDGLEAGTPAVRISAGGVMSNSPLLPVTR